MNTNMLQGISDRVLLEFLSSKTNLSIVEICKITEGESNDVYKLLSIDGKSYILKIQISDFEDFEFENVLKDKARKVGVPVPKTLNLGNHNFAKGINQQFEIQEFLECHNANVYKNGAIYNDLEFQNYFLEQVGLLLKKLHSLNFERYGIHRVERSTSDFIEYKIQSLDNIRFDDSSLYSFTKFTLQEIKNLIILQYKKLTPSHPTLCHCDIEPSHIFMKDDKIVGLIDFGIFQIDDFRLEFAYWSFWYGDVLPINMICKAYGIEDIDSFKQELLPFEIEIALKTSSWYDSIQHTDKLKFCISRLTNYLKQLEM